MFDGPSGNGKPTPAEDEAWRQVPIDELKENHGLPATVIRALADTEILTLGQLADYTASGKALTDIAGIGKAKAETIDAATESYWQAHPQQVLPAVLSVALTAMSKADEPKEQKEPDTK